MALNISAWSIRRPLPAVLLSIILLILGWVSFLKLPVTRLPAADIPVVSVAVSQFGAGPSELEAQVTKYIEDSVSGVEGVRHIASQITDGLSVTTIRPNSPEAWMRAAESPGKTPWVATASIEAAPASLYACAAWISDPPVRIMSS